MPNLESPATPAAETAPAVRVRGVNHAFGEGSARNQVLFDNHLEVMPGEIVIMSGPSGSGKTTLLTLIGALRSVQEGALEVLGDAVNGLAKTELVGVRRRIGFIFQAHNLFDSLTAFENVRMSLELHGFPRAEVRRRAVEMLEAVGLGHRVHYKPSALSGGQRQRVAVARALAPRPKLVLADEPTAALDEKSGRDVVTLLQKLAAEEGTTSLIVTHDNRILDVADRIVNMVGGRIKSDVAVRESVQLCEFLKACAFFSGFSPDHLAQMAGKMARARFAAGTEVIRQGEEGDLFYIIRRGSADVFIAEDGVQRFVRTMHKGEFFGEKALIEGETRSATVRAREELETWTLGKQDFQEALRTSSSFQEQLRKVYFQRQ